MGGGAPGKFDQHKNTRWVFVSFDLLLAWELLEQKLEKSKWGNQWFCNVFHKVLSQEKGFQKVIPRAVLGKVHSDIKLTNSQSQKILSL